MTRVSPSLVVLALVSAAGCDAYRSGDKVVVEVDTKEAKEKAREAGEQIQAGAEAAGAAINAGKQELDIRAALTLDGSIDRSAIAILTDEPTRTIRLTGSVPTEEQKLRVDALAREKAEDWVVVNELIVAPAAAAPAGTTAMAPAGATIALPAGTTITMPAAPGGSTPAPANPTTPAPATASAP